MAVPTPTIGTVVLFKSHPDRYEPAIVNRVWPDGKVNLTVFRDGGATELIEWCSAGRGMGEWVPVSTPVVA